MTKSFEGPPPAPRLRDEMKPSHREMDKSGVVISTLSAIMMTLAYATESINEISAALVQTGLDPGLVSKICGGIALFGILYGLATKAKKNG